MKTTYKTFQCTAVSELCCQFYLEILCKNYTRDANVTLLISVHCMVLFRVNCYITIYWKDKVFYIKAHAWSGQCWCLKSADFFLMMTIMQWMSNKLIQQCKTNNKFSHVICSPVVFIFPENMEKKNERQFLLFSKIDEVISFLYLIKQLLP